jgi:hypothetical protein
MSDPVESPLIPRLSKFTAEVAAIQHRMERELEGIVTQFAIETGVAVEVSIVEDAIKPTQYNVTTKYTRLG